MKNRMKAHYFKEGAKVFLVFQGASSERVARFKSRLELIYSTGEPHINRRGRNNAP